jgi:peptidoglycan/LPS O-acetylase OafA/YrhL
MGEGVGPGRVDVTAPTRPPPEEPDRARGTRRADVQGLRAIAVLMVVAFHAGLDVPGGFTGVDVFFVISGFEITAMLLRNSEATGRSSLADFYARRVRRIMPASALTIGVVAVASYLAINAAAQPVTARTGIAGSLFTANVLLARATTGYFDVATTDNPLLHIWTLSVEEQFYLVFPALLLAGLVLGRRRAGGIPAGRLAAIVGVVAIGSFAVGWYTSTHDVHVPGFPSAAQFAFYMAPARAWEFAAGALVALGVRHWRRLPEGAAHALALVGLGLVAIAAFGIDGTTEFPGTAALLPVGGAVLLLVAGTATTRGIPAVLGLRPLAVVGDYSYSWYLWHWPLIVFAVALLPREENAALIGAVVSVVPAWLSFRLVETPLRLDPRIRGRRAVAVALVCIVVPVLACLALLRAPTPSASASTRALQRTIHQHHADRLRGCNRGVPYGSLPLACTFAVPDAAGTVLLIGDSNAGQFTEAAAAGANAAGYNLVVTTFPECPLVDLRVSASGRPRDAAACRRFATRSLRGIEARPPDLVILAASGPNYLTSTARFEDPATGEVATTAATKARLWTTGLRRVLERLQAAGTPAVVIHTVPQWRAWDPRSCAEALVYLAPRQCGAEQSRAEVARFRAASLAADRRALDAVPDAVGVDLVDDLCAQRCRTNRADTWIYRDGRHISVATARDLSDRFEDIVVQHARP